MISTKSVANAVSGKTARACDSCVKKRARWYCAADDAFLCQVCDSAVHSANPLARRHERVRLKTASFKLLSAPTWHKGFTKKARTRRSPKGWKANPVPFVPEVSADEISQHEENDEEQLLYRVPIFDPFVAELYSNEGTGRITSGEKSESPDATNPQTEILINRISVCGSQTEAPTIRASVCGYNDNNKLRGFFPSDLDLAEFAADVESMLGKGLEDQSFTMEDLGMVDDVKVSTVKVESEESSRESGGEEIERMEVDVDGRETFELNFDYDSPEASCGAEDEKVESRYVEEEGGGENNGGKSGRRKVLLTLDYEAVIGEWASRGSPWTTTNRPEINPAECLPDFWIIGGNGLGLAYGEFSGMGMAPAAGDGGREARVSRYREKRRTRLFSKKIRYEVRKLNAEKRPRMKGRFVKRVSVGAPPAPTNSFALP